MDENIQSATPTEQTKPELNIAELSAAMVSVCKILEPLSDQGKTRVIDAVRILLQFE